MSDADQLFRVHAEQIGDVLQIALDCNGCRAKEKRISALEEENEKLRKILTDILDAHHLSEVDWDAMREAEKMIGYTFTLDDAESGENNSSTIVQPDGSEYCKSCRVRKPYHSRFCKELEESGEKGE